MSLAKYLALDKVANFFTIIRQNGGIRGSLWKLYRQDELKNGTLIGQDKFGNKYFENPRYFYGRNRWVEYADQFHMNYDGSQVPAEWYGWLHYKTDLPPHQSMLNIDRALRQQTAMQFGEIVYYIKDPSRPKYSWMAYGNENLSGTTGQYTPYSTTRPKVEPWTPKSKST